MVSIHPDTRFHCILETPEGLILRVPVLRIDPREALLDTEFRLPPQDGFEVILERSDGHAEVMNTEIREGTGGLLLRWDFRHPSEMIALEKLLETPVHALGSGRDVPLDIEAALFERTRVVSTSQIAAKRDSIRVLKLDTVRELIATSVDEALARSTERVDAQERERILEESERRFQELFAQLKAEKEGAAQQRARLEEQLDRARAQLDAERAREIGAERFTLSDEGIHRIERTMHRYLDGALAAGRTDPALEAELRATVEGILDSERARISDLARAASNDRIELLEQKITRLSRSLEDTQKERDRARERAHSLESAGGIGPVTNIHRPGIAAEDPEKGRKLALLADLVRENHDLRRKMEEEGRGAPRLAVPSAAASAAPAAGPTRADGDSASPKNTIDRHTPRESSLAPRDE